MMTGVFSRQKRAGQIRWTLARHGWAPRQWAAAILAFALSLHVLLAALAGVAQADPAGPLRTVIAADALMCSGTGMRPQPSGPSGIGPGGPSASGDTLCAVCLPLVPESLPSLAGPNPAAAPFATLAAQPTRSGPDLPQQHRPRPRAPPLFA